MPITPHTFVNDHERRYQNVVLLVPKQELISSAQYQALQQNLQRIDHIINIKNLPIKLQIQQTDTKFTQKVYQRLSVQYEKPILVLEDTSTLNLITAGMAVTPQWQKLQKRVVIAGRRSELLLQAAKINQHANVLDATAGFGHDSLILASTGAKITMLEQLPILVLLLSYEQLQMQKQNNWQKLMQRLTIIHANAEQFLNQITQNFDLIYLDPMFPEGSYQHLADKSTQADANLKTLKAIKKGAKVGKLMQALHHMALPPTASEQRHLFDASINNLSSNSSSTDSAVQQNASNNKRLIIKRPVAAPYFADMPPHESWQNQVVRFDGYFVSDTC